MKNVLRNSVGVLLVLSLVCLVSMLASCSKDDNQAIQTKVDSMKTELKKVLDERATLETNLATFDTLDYTVFSNQQWTRLHESHAKDIKVYWPDGHMTQGIDVHIEDLKALFVHAPDTRIKEHPIRFGSRKYTAVTGVFEGTFTKPMPIGNGKFIQPTGKTFKMPMATIGIWENGIMTAEHLFWDNQTYMKQIGLAK